MPTKLRGRVSQIAGDLVQIWDARTGHSLYLQRTQIDGGDDLRLNDEVLVEGDGAHRRARRAHGPAPVDGLAAAGAD